jgi:hypothetical protein
MPMDAAPPDPDRSLFRSNPAETTLATSIGGVSQHTSGKTHWGVARVTVWVLVIAWSAALIVTGVTGMFVKAFL